MTWIPPLIPAETPKPVTEKIIIEEGEDEPELVKTPDEVERPSCPICHSSDYVKIVEGIVIYDFASPGAYDYHASIYFMANVDEKFKWACMKCRTFFYYTPDWKTGEE